MTDEIVDYNQVDYSNVDFQEMVREFHQAFGAPIGTRVQGVSYDRHDLRIDLIDEEFRKELIPALRSHNQLEVYDACLDILYVTFGLMVEAGMDARPGFIEVHRSNMSKLGEDGKPILREDGKVLKGPNYFKPRLMEILEGQGANFQIKVTYRTKEGYSSQAYINEHTHVGTNKHTDEPVKVEWSDVHDTWVEV